MKGLIIGVVAVVVIGVAGFGYRYMTERAPVTAATNGSTASTTACTAEAKVCPDGSAVGRTGPSCSFAICPPPNVEITVGSTTLGFVLPAGYTSVDESGSNGDASSIANYVQSAASMDASKGTASTTPGSSTITIHDYAIPTGSTPGQVMLDQTVFDPSGLQATSTSSFANVTKGSNVFSVVNLGVSEGMVETAYYLTTQTDVFRFDIVERGVTNWNDPSLSIATLPQHQALQQMLATLQVTTSK